MKIKNCLGCGAVLTPPKSGVRKYCNRACMNKYIRTKKPNRSEYNSWRAMKARCGNPNDKKYHNYGGRGISVCERWRGSFDAFLADMGNKPTPKHEIDRVDSDGNYEPSNCRWVTHAVNTQRIKGRTIRMCDAKTIMWLYQNNHMGVSRLAAEWAVSVSCIENIVYGTSWKHDWKSLLDIPIGEALASRYHGIDRRRTRR
jgi:hypothetical protein